MKPIYLDYNATTPILPEVAQAMTPFLHEHFGNPSSNHSFGIASKRAIEEARAKLARLVRCDCADVIFTSGGTESNNIALKGVAFAYPDRGRHIITSAVEHPAVMQVCRWLATQGFELTVLPVDGYGAVDPADLEKAITSETMLVTVMHANNEVGTIEPIRALADIAHRHGALMHTDAAQSLGKIPATMDSLGADLISIAGHKLYAPKGIGALCVRSHVQLAKLLHGADHESGRRPGTENVLEIVGLGEASRLADAHLESNMSHYQQMRDRMHEGLLRELGEETVRLNGHPTRRLPNTLSVSFHHVEANTLLAEIGNQVAASAGAACHTDKVEMSPVLEAMKVPVEWAMGTVRFSVGNSTTSQDIDRAVTIVAKAVKRLRPSADGGATVGMKKEDRAYKLTAYTHGLGCACKLRPQELEKVLASLPAPDDPDVIVGTDTSDDAAVYRLNDRLAIVQTVDFFTPIVDDPYWFGAISAANSLSDIYAMGARPLFALNIVGFPSGRLPMSVLETILRGALDKAAEAGISVIGGHTVEDTEPKFGLAVTGVIDPSRLLRNNTAQPGDVLVLTKPLGVGIISTAAKRGLAEEDVIRESIEVMAMLNRAASEALHDAGCNACTDITGFGLLGHLRELAAGSRVDVELSARAVPILQAAVRFAGAGIVPGGTLNNLDHVADHVRFSNEVSKAMQLVLADAQTSGGLLASLPAHKAEAFLAVLREAGVKDAAVIGRITGKGSGLIHVRS
ncbi:MAG: selenide, water dikinase SelD [Candidatus Latescibacterota bacterium]